MPGSSHNSSHSPACAEPRLLNLLRVSPSVKLRLQSSINIMEAVRIALHSLWANKLRSALTLLGMVIGVAAVITVVTFVNGLNGYVSERIFNLGADVFILSKMPPVITNADQFLEGRKRKDLTLEDYQAVAENCKTCQVVGDSTITFK